jgi:hypothetical protein
MNGAASRRSWSWPAAFLALTVVGAARIVSSSSAFFQTSDEGLHVACGVLWARSGHDFFCLDEPPLARIASVVPLFLNGDLTGLPENAQSAREVQGVFRGKYERTLRLARLGVLPFFVAASWLVWVWARRGFGEGPALASVFLFQALPLVLAHSGLVTTDMAATALIPLVFYLGIRWLKEPSPARSVVLGVVAGLAILAKHSAFPFLLAGSLPIAIAKSIEEPRAREEMPPSWIRRLSSLLVVGILVITVVWAGYRFSLTPIAVASGRPHSVFRFLRIDRALSDHPRALQTLDRLLESPMPFGDFLRGTRLVASHNAVGHPAFFLGEVREFGWWQFFPVLLAVKTPIPFLAFATIGIALLRRTGQGPAWQRLAPALAAAGILLLSIGSRIDIGLRHLLPIFPLLAIPAGVGLHQLLSARKQRVACRLGAALLIAWFVASSASAHPDYLPYFNELAAGHPERITVDSDLDWGQDIKRLFAVLTPLRAEKLFYACVGCSYLRSAGDLGVPGTPKILEELEPYRGVSGWIAVDEWAIAVKGEMERRRQGGKERGFDWLGEFPFRRIGRSIRLYRAPG